MVVVQNLEVALEIPSQEDLQAQSQGAVEAMEILNLLVVVVAEVGHVLPALLHLLLAPLQCCSSQLQQKRHHHLVTLEEIRVTPFPSR
jgi:hypothetical protein